MTASRLSIGVPVYNQADTISATIRSLLQQTHPGRAIVVSENHSTDGTADALREFGDQITVVQPPRHLSMTANWNFVTSQLATQWFALLSGDDLACPNYVEVFEELAAAHEGAVLLRAGHHLISGSGDVIGSHVSARLPTVRRAPKTLTEQLVTSRTSFAAFAARHAAWAAIGGFDERLNMLSDWGFFLSLAPLGDFIYSRQVVSAYRLANLESKASSRCLLEAHDAERIVMEIIPRIAAEMNVRPRACQNSARFLLHRVIERLVEFGTRQARLEVAELTEDWAARVGEGEPTRRRLVGDEQLPRWTLALDALRAGMLPNSALQVPRRFVSRVRARAGL